MIKAKQFSMQVFWLFVHRVFTERALVVLSFGGQSSKLAVLKFQHL